MIKKIGQTRPQLFSNFKNKFGAVDGILHITLTKNNTLLTLTDVTGDVWTWTSCRNCGFTGSQKSTEMATISTAEEMGHRAQDLKLKNVYAIFHGGARFRQAVLRGLRRSGIKIGGLIIENSLAYNGCRLRKRKRS
jgi:small subunit ribosomal protein S11